MGAISEVLRPEEASEPILAKPVRGALLEWLTEIWAEDELTAVGLTARRRAIFHGAPGTGKTTLAHHLSARLGLPMAIIRPDDVVGRYVGTGISNVASVFDSLAALQKEGTPHLAFFDEFETIGCKRMTSGVNEAVEHDHNATINALLARLDGYGGFIIAATNNAALIDQAVWRRFDIHIALAAPGQGERKRILQRYLAPFGLPRHALEHLATSFETGSPALMRQFCEALKRQMVIGPKVGWDMAKRPTIARIIAAIEPHPDLGRPRLWSHGADDHAVAVMPWPLPRAETIVEEQPEQASAENVIAWGRR